MGDPNGRLPYVPVPASEQREALAFLNREIFGPDSFKFSPGLLNKLAMERFPDIEGPIWTATRNDLPIHSLVLAIQSLPMNRLYHPIALGRLNDLEARYDGGKDAFTMAKIITPVRQAARYGFHGCSIINFCTAHLHRKPLHSRIGPPPLA